MFEGIKNTLSSYMKFTFNGFDEMLVDVTDILQNGLDAWDEMLLYADVLKPFALTIISICLLIELAQIAQKVDLIKWEMVFRVCIKMVLAKVCIDVAPTFLKACFVQSQTWISSLSGTIAAGSLGTVAERTLDPLLDQFDSWNILWLFISTFMVMIAIKVCELIVFAIAYGRVLEIYVYAAVSPLPCAFLPLGNGDGTGMSRITSKFFKSFIAVCLQGVMMLITIAAFNAVVGGTIENALIDAGSAADANAAIIDIVFTMLLGSIALVMAVVKSGSWAKSIMDAA